MEFRILGPLEVCNEAGAVPLRGGKPRTVLAVLLMHANEPVSADQLALALWGDGAPAGAAGTVQVHVSRLRKALGDAEVVTTTPAGYRLRVRPGELDAHRFEQLVERGRRALAAGQPQEASAILRQAASLWRGPPLADLAYEPFAQTEIARLEEEQLAALEARIEADAAAGRHAELVGELRQLVARHPTRERLAGQLMLALYRCGRQAEALEAFQEARRRLAGEIGVEPSPELRDLQDAILHHDSSLTFERIADDLPEELATAGLPPLIGRGAELRWLLDRWEQAAAGTGALVTIAGAPGIGKTRLVAELADEVHRRGAGVLFASGKERGSAFLGTLARVREAMRPTLLVLDDADQTAGEVSRAITDWRGEGERVPVLVLAIGVGSEALAALRPGDVLELEPLGLEAVRAIAARYAPDRNPADVPAEWLLEASGGVPRRVHDVSGRWARREAARRVGALADRAAVGRAELRSVEADLAGGVVQLQTAREQVEPSERDGEYVVCPFKGLASFETSDAPYFFGRERLVAELVARLVGAPLLAVVGPSGSGKSSVVRAGLLPALASGMLPGSEDWPQALIRPGEHPTRELARATSGLDAERRAVVVVDQFEEAFTVCRDEDERAAFISHLVRASQGRDGGVVVVAIRADFYGRCAAYPELSRLLASNHVLVGSMRHVELRRAIIGPAHRVGLQIDDELAEALVSDVEHEPGALPLLSTALLELWQRRDGRRLRFATYEATGGVLGAVARLAEEAFGRLDEKHQALTRTVLLRLAEVEAEGGVERRRLPLADLAAEGGGDAAHVIGLLADARLLTLSEGTVEFAHEALLREWPRLREWIEDDREDLRVHRSLSAAAQEWQRLGRDDSALHRGARLAEAHEWAHRGDPGPTDAEREFLGASTAREQRARTARRRRIAIAFGGLALSLVAIAAVAIVAVNQRGDAERQRNIAVSRELALQSANAVEADPGLGLALAMRAVDTSPTPAAAAALRQATLSYRELAVLRGDSKDVETAAYSPSGQEAVGGGGDGIVRVWDVRTRRGTARLDAGHGGVLAARYSRDGQSIALGFEDGTVAVTDPGVSRLRPLLRVAGQSVSSVAFSGAGTQIAAGFQDGTVRVAATDGVGADRLLGAHDDGVAAVDMSAAGGHVVSAGSDGGIRLWNVDGSAVRDLHTGDRPQTAVSFSPDGKRVLAAGHDGIVRLWHVDVAAAPMRLEGESRELLAASFSSDGRRLAAGGQDGAIRVWSISGGPPVAVLRSPSRVLDIGFGPTNDRLISVGGDGVARIWDAGRTQSWRAPEQAYAIDFSSDGRLIVGSGGEDGTVSAWETATGRLVDSLPGRPRFTLARFSPRDESVVIVGDPQKTVQLWRIGEDAPRDVARLRRDRAGNAASFDDTGQRIVYADDKSRVVVHDLRSGGETILGGLRDQVWDVRFSPDGMHVAAATDSGAVVVWSLNQPETPEHVLDGHEGYVVTLAYSPDGKRLASVGEDRTVRVWRATGGRGRVLRGHDQDVTGVAFTRDERRVITSSADGTVRLWDVRGGESLAVLDSGTGPLYHLALSRDGRIATLGDQAVRVFRCDVCGTLAEVRALARSRAARSFSQEEKRRFVTVAP
jgi:WD40 repeat protein/DNA-binding SARP family transcriptional activator